MCCKYAVITDADHSIGTGHAVRQVTLARRARQLGLNALFLSKSPEVARLCQDQGFPFIPISDPDDAAARLAALCCHDVIFDVHQTAFESYRAAVEQCRRSVLIVSDIGKPFVPFGTHMIMFGSGLDQVSSQEIHHGVHPTVIHAGRAFVFFRDEFKCSPGRPAAERNREILVCHGGADPHGLTLRCLRALEYTRETYLINLVVGALFGPTKLLDAATRASRHQCVLEVNPRRPSDWMRRSALALISGGNVRYELCVTRTPFAAIAFRKEQFLCTEQISRMGAGLNLGIASELRDEQIAQAVDMLMSDVSARQQMQDAMGALFDQQGADRVLSLLVETKNTYEAERNSS